MVVLNAKSTTSGCVWRLLPLEVVDEGYTFDVNDAPEFAVEYHGVGQFLSQYKGNPELELVTSVSSELLGFEGVTLSYTSDNEDVVYFTTVDGKTIFNCGGNGIANVTIAATHGNNTHSQTISITVVPNAEYDTITVDDAIATEVGEEVLVRGIVGPSLVNKVGFYLFDETGVIAVETTKEELEGLAIGNEVVIKGTRILNKGTQIAVSSAKVIANYYGNHDYEGDFFITDKTLAQMIAESNDSSSTVRIYVVKAKVKFTGGGYSTNVFVTADSGSTELMLYCSGS
jgi:hypothetical protein